MRALLVCLGSVVAGAVMLRAAETMPILVESPGTFKTLVNPNCSHCKDEAKRRRDDLRDDDRVLCWIRGKYDGGAIPFRFFLNPYRVISDTYGVFVYDADAGFVRGFAPSLDFVFHGWRNGVMVIKHQDGTLFSSLSGVAFAGPRRGARLEPIPTLQSDWGYWLKRYPDTVAYHMFAKYKPVLAPAKATEGSIKSRGNLDSRLPAEERVLGVRDDKSAKAYPLAALRKVKLLKDQIGKRTCYVLYHEPTRTAAAYAMFANPPAKGGRVIGVELTLDEKTPEAPFKDRATASSFDVAGRCVSGKLKGCTLRWLDGVEVRWFAWVAEFPHTKIHGK